MDLNANLNISLRDADFKDESPSKTVEKIRGILFDNGIETEEHWFESRVPYCHSLEVHIKNTTFSTYGKGLTREFALASGYGELMERLQLGHVNKEQKDGSYSINNSKNETVKAADLLKRNRKWYELYSEELKISTGEEMTPEEILAQFTDENGDVLATPFFCATTKTKEYLPAKMRKLIGTTNGYAAGNTLEEAIVQASSEIVERAHKVKILSGKYAALPTVPEEVLMRYPIAYDIITYLRNNGITVFVKDCSLGTKFPALCVCYINKKTGKYTTHFGAYPVFEIALTRALTETFQGPTIDSFTRFSGFFYNVKQVNSLNSFYNDHVYGASERMPEFFMENKELKFNKNVGFSGKNNKELCLECIEFFRENGDDVLIRDCSFLGFPTCQIILPAHSELLINRLSPKHNERRYSENVERIMRNPSSATIDDILELIMHINANKKNPASLEYAKMARLSVNLSRDEEIKIKSAVMAHLYYTLGEFSPVANYIGKMLPFYSPEEGEELLCLHRYFTMLDHGYSEDSIRKTLSLFHKPETVETLYSNIESGINPLDKYTPHCEEENCTAACPLIKICSQKKVREINSLVLEKTLAANFDESTKKLKKIF